MKKRVSSILLASLLAVGILGFNAVTPVAANASILEYEHNPALNEKVMEDVVVDENAVYGFRPDPNSDRLGAYADSDWTDKASVAKWTDERIAYHNDFTTMYEAWKKMESQGKSIEEIARYVSNMRNEIRLASYDGNPEGLAKVKQSNLKKYGNEKGPTADSLFEKYGSWEKVLLKSFSENPGMDACLGLYDIYYDLYSLVGSLSEKTEQTYVVKKGDHLSKIAKKYYGDSTKWTKIYEANKDSIKDPNQLQIGQKLVIIIK